MNKFYQMKSKKKLIEIMFYTSLFLEIYQNWRNQQMKHQFLKPTFAPLFIKGY